MSGSYQLNQNDQGQFSFVLVAGNGETILRSEMYDSKEAVGRGIASVQKNSPLDDRYVRLAASDGRFYFNLTAANHQVIGTSQLYASAQGREAGIESVKVNGPTTVGAYTRPDPQVLGAAKA